MLSGGSALSGVPALVATLAAERTSSAMSADLETSGLPRLPIWRPLALSPPTWGPLAWWVPAFSRANPGSCLVADKRKP
eukprot:346250-Pyramimonas_sp.AAC.1